jgi:ABC-type sulfate transport system permease subunit
VKASETLQVAIQHLERGYSHGKNESYCVESLLEGFALAAIVILQHVRDERRQEEEENDEH